jgi:hypothetical protein
MTSQTASRSGTFRSPPPSRLVTDGPRGSRSCRSARRFLPTDSVPGWTRVSDPALFGDRMSSPLVPILVMPSGQLGDLPQPFRRGDICPPKSVTRTRTGLVGVNPNSIPFRRRLS